MSVLDVSGELSLKVMAGVVSVEGKGAYLKSSVENEDTMEVLAHAFFTTVRLLSHFINMLYCLNTLITNNSKKQMRK